MLLNVQPFIKYVTVFQFLLHDSIQLQSKTVIICLGLFMVRLLTIVFKNFNLAFSFLSHHPNIELRESAINNFKTLVAF